MPRLTVAAELKFKYSSETSDSGLLSSSHTGAAMAAGNLHYAARDALSLARFILCMPVYRNYLGYTRR